MAPNTAQDWITVADERAADAEAMLPSREDSTGPIYSNPAFLVALVVKNTDA